jgi:hypothetical protein
LLSAIVFEHGNICSLGRGDALIGDSSCTPESGMVTVIILPSFLIQNAAQTPPKG